MFEDSFEKLKRKYPFEARALTLLKIQSELSEPGDEFALQELLEITQPVSNHTFMFALMEAEKAGIIKRKVRVESPEDKIFAEYDSMANISHTQIENWQNNNVNITLDHISTVYRFQPAT